MFSAALRLFGVFLIPLLSNYAHGSTLCPTKLIHQFPQNTWIENIAVRRNGSLLLTSLLGLGGLTSLDPAGNAHPVTIVDTFPGVNSTVGIVEARADVFFVIGSNYTIGATTRPEQGTNTVFEVDFNARDESGRPVVRVLARVRDAVELNGLTKYNDTLLLAADSGLGAVWGIDTHTGSYHIVAKDVLMQPEPPSEELGINGVRYRPETGKLYFTNTQRRLFASLRLGANAKPLYPVLNITTSLDESGVEINWDDFGLDGYGNAYIATQQGNSIQMVTPGGETRVIAGNLNSTDLAEPTSAQLGRTWRDRDTLYVTTVGGYLEPVYQGGKPVKLGAQVVAVDLSRCARVETAHRG
nr:hypothetical protein CFP56_11642 [Quercus suber]